MLTETILLCIQHHLHTAAPGHLPRTPSGGTKLLCHFAPLLSTKNEEIFLNREGHEDRRDHEKEFNLCALFVFLGALRGLSGSTDSHRLKKIRLPGWRTGPIAVS